MAAANQYAAGATLLSNATAFLRPAYTLDLTAIQSRRELGVSADVWPADFDADGTMDVAIDLLDILPAIDPVSSRRLMRPRDFADLSQKIGDAADHAANPADRRSAHIRAIQAQIDALGRGDIAGVLQHAHPDVELEIFAPLEFRWVTRARGTEEVRRAIAHNFDSVEDQQPEVLNIVSEGDVVVLIGRERGVIRASREAYDVQFVQRFTFRAGRLAAVQIIAANTTPGGDGSDGGLRAG